jgi:hypothetical protein
MFWTEKERQSFWERDEVRFAELAHEYLCCDIPTLRLCKKCDMKPKTCPNKKDLTVYLGMDYDNEKDIRVCPKDNCRCLLQKYK